MDVFSNDLESMGRVTSQQRSAFQRVVKKAQAGRRRSQQAPARPPQARQAVAVRTPRNGAKRKPIARW